MKSKIWIILIIILTLALLASCGGGDTRTATGEYIEIENVEKIFSDDEKQLLDSNYLDDEIKEILEASASRDLPEGVYDKIHRAFLDGEIDRKTEVLLMLQAVYAPEGLPEEYAGPKYKGGKKSLGSELQWLISHRQELDPETEAKVRPFILSPKDPGSYFHPAFDDDSSILQSFLPVKTAHAAGNDWSKKSVAISGVSSDITIYFREKSLPAEKQLEIEMQVLEIEEALKKAWPKFKDLLGLQPGYDLDIFLTDKLAADIDGEAYPLNGGNYQIRLNEAAAGDKLKSTTVHELFHIFQFALGLNWYDVSTDLLWLLEATATWSEDYLQDDLYPSYNSEHLYLNEFFGSLNSDRLSTMGTQEYGSYLLFYFLTDYWGTENDVASILHVAASEKDSMDIRGMLMRYIGLEEMQDTYGQFAWYNWNRTPYKKYSDSPSFPDTIPWGKSTEKNNMNSLEEKEYSVSMTSGAIVYQHFVFALTPEEMPWVKFDFENSIPQYEIHDAEYVKRQALIKVGSTWEYEDWTDLDDREFCRRKDEEHVKAIYLIHSNANLQESMDYQYTVNTKGDCPMKGYTKVNWELTSGAEGMVITESFDLYSEDEIEYCPLSDAFVLTKRNTTFNSLNITEMPNPFHMPDVPEVGPATITQKVEGAGTISEKYDEDEQFWKLTVNEDGTVTLNIFPETKTTGWITYTETGDMRSEVKKRDYPPITRGSIDLENGSKSYTTHTGEKITQNCIIGESTISGNLTIETIEGLGLGKNTIEFEYDISGWNQ